MEGESALLADVSGIPLEGHDGDGPGVLGDLGLLRRDDVHDHAALELLGHAALDAVGAGAGGRGAVGGLVRCHGMLPLDRRISVTQWYGRSAPLIPGTVGSGGDVPEAVVDVEVPG